MSRMRVAALLLVTLAFAGAVVWWSGGRRTANDADVARPSHSGPEESGPAKTASADREPVRQRAPFSTITGDCGAFAELFSPEGSGSVLVQGGRQSLAWDYSTLHTNQLLAWVRDAKEDRSRRLRALRSLAKRSAEAGAIVPVLVDVLTKPLDKDLEHEVTASLVGLEADRSGHAVIDRELLTIPAKQRFWLAWQLRQAKSPVSGLVALLKSSNAEVQSLALNLLAKMGDDTREAIPDLERMQREDSDAQLRESVMQLLSRLSANSMAPLLAGIRDADPVVRGRAAAGLVRMGKPAVPHLRALLAEPERDIRASAISALGRIGPEAKDAVADLLPLRQDDDPLIRKLAGDALEKIDE